MDYKSAKILVQNNNLRYFRKQNGLTQKEICLKLKELGLEINRSTYSKYEEGARKIPCEVLILLAYCHNVSIDDFFTSTI